MNKETYIESICNKLVNNEQLSVNEINSIISALRESSNCLQEPYYEVIYHDKYDNTEHRIMNPISSRSIENLAGTGHIITEDHFELHFRRIERG